MARLKFPAAQLNELLEHAENAEQHRQTYGETGAVPALHLAKDHGIYLMSNGLPILREDANEKPECSHVVYADGFDPRKDVDTWWEDATAAVGGDDFVESLPLARMFTPSMRLAIKHAESGWLVVNVSKRTITMSISGIKVRPAWHTDPNNPINHPGYELPAASNKA